MPTPAFAYIAALTSSFRICITRNLLKMRYDQFVVDERVASPSSPTNFAQSIKLRDAIKEYEASKWKVIGQKVGKPAKVGCTFIHMSPIDSTFDSNLISCTVHRLASSMPKSISRIFELLHPDDSLPCPH